ncbi:MAG: phytanoyl-CoA dioxygenase family protein [Actinobacteria bacterium]|nr:phytanoyl-CoA dioxygenase family protein [Actinomycetota bacterium]
MPGAVSISASQIPYFGGPWFMSPFFERELADRELDAKTEAMVRDFSERGYVVLDDLGVDFDELCERAIGDLAARHRDSEGEFNRIQDAWTVSDAVRSLALAPNVLSVLEALYGRRPIPFQTLNFLRGSQQLTHSDSFHFHSFPKHYMCGVWIALEDLHEANGPLHYYPGSHRLPDYEAFGPGKHDEFVAYIAHLIAGLGLEKEQATLRRGQALVWSANLLHGGDPVADADSTRLSQVTHYFFDGCSYFSPVESDMQRGQIQFRRVVDIGSGEPLPLETENGPVSLPASDWLARLKIRRRRFADPECVRFVI